jgi:hypothetical protein
MGTSEIQTLVNKRERLCWFCLVSFLEPTVAGQAIPLMDF